MADYETIQRNRNITVGIFVLAGVIGLGWLIFKFGDMPASVTKFRSFTVFVQFPAATGVGQDTPVRFCGYQIGRVTKVKSPEIREDLFSGLRYHQTVVVLSIDKKFVNIPSNVEIKLMTRGLGSSYLEFKLDPTKQLERLEPNKPETVYLVDGALVQGSAGMTSEFFPEESQKKLEELVDSFRALITNANSILGDQANQANIKTTLANLTEATKQATSTLKKVEEFSAVGAETLKNTDARMEKVVTAIVGIGEELSKTLVEMRVVLEKVNSGEGSVGKLINDGRLYENLLENAEQLELLLREARDLMAEFRKKGIKIKL